MRIYFLLISAAATALAQRPMRPIPIAPPGSNAVTVQWTELQGLKLDNIELKLKLATTPLLSERDALLIKICTENNFDLKTCKVDGQTRSTSGVPTAPPAKKKKKEHY